MAQLHNLDSAQKELSTDRQESKCYRDRIVETESAIAQSFKVKITSMERCKIQKKKTKQNKADQDGQSSWNLTGNHQVIKWSCQGHQFWLELVLRQ